MDGNRSHTSDELDEFLASLDVFIASLDDAGVALDLGFEAGHIREQLRQRGETPAPYRQLTDSWKGSEDRVAALDRVLRPAQEHNEYSRRMTTGLAYPAIVATIACVVAGAMGYQLLPIFESTYQQMNEPVGPAVARLQVLRALTPLWLVGVPVAIAYGVRWARRSDKRLTAPPRRSALAEWASRSGGDEDRRAVAELEASQTHARVWRRTTYWPLLALVVVGGGATLLLGLALFEPMIELLYRLAG